MIREIEKDAEVLSTAAVELDESIMKEVIQDLLDTALANRRRCVGLAANQVGSFQPIFVVLDEQRFLPITAPKVKAVSTEVKATLESCLSVPGQNKRVRRHKWIKIEYLDFETNKQVTKKFKDPQARIIQHELDHLKGIVI